MFARDTSKKSNALAEAKRGPTITAPAQEGLNPIWQSLALRPSAIQAKLSISQPGDTYEREADHIADQIMRMPPAREPIQTLQSGAPGLSRLVQRQAAQQAAAPASTSRAGLIKEKKLDTLQNVNDLAGILYHETRGELGVDMKVAIGWIVLNRMLILDRTSVASLIGGNQLASLPGGPFKLKLLAQMLLSGQYEDTTNGSFFYFTPKIMPDVPNEGCCSGKTGPCNEKRFEKGVDCKGNVQTVPGTKPAEQRFFPSFAQPAKRQAQPSGTDPMLIQVYQR